MQSLFSLSGRNAVVTGGSSGIGQAIALALSSAGARIVVAARREHALRQTVASIQQGGGEATYVVADLSCIQAAADYALAFKKPFGTIDILINCAGVNLRERVDDITSASWQQTLDINLSMPFFLARELIADMKIRGGGKIINIASLQSLRAFPNGLAYGASKGGVCQLTRAMAEAWSEHGICCNAIAPGFFPTELTSAVFNNAETVDKAAQQTAIGRNGQLEDIHGIAIFLAASASDYITGQTIFVDGGFTAK